MSIAVRALQKRYGDFSVEIDFAVADGETLVLAGPSGCGKTTALRMIAGLVPPDAGSVVIDGNDVRDVPPWKRGMGVVFQDLALFPHLSVGGNVAYGPFVRGARKSERSRIVRECLAVARLSGYEKRRIHTLSGGERQRAAIARALASSPRALLMDEPFSSLDAPLRKALRAEFRELREDSEYPCLFVTHDREEAAYLADRLALMKNGRIVEMGPPRDLFLAPRTAFAARFLGAGIVLDAECVGSDGGRERVRSAIGETVHASIAGSAGTGRALLIPGGAVRVVSAEPGQGRCGAIVRTSFNAGDRELLSVELSGGIRIELDAESADRKGGYRRGEAIGLSFDERRLRLVEKEGD